MKFSDILGQNKIKDHFRQAAAGSRAAHSYIIEGEKFSGKMMLARAFANALVCEDFDGQDSCGVCLACMKAASDNHPDIIYVNHEKPNLISVEEIRSQVIADIDIRPYSSAYKIYIIDDANLMNRNAQNAILKTIEEPPSYAVVILLTDNANLLLPTIRSRCVKLSMIPVKRDEIVSFLMERYETVDYKARAYASYAQGNVGAAVNMAVLSEGNERRDMVISILRNATDADTEEMLSAIKKLDAEKANINEIFNLMTLWYRDVLLYKSTGQTKDIVLQDEARYIINTAKAMSYRGLSEVFSTIETTRRRIASNVNFATSLELLFYAMKENRWSR